MVGGLSSKGQIMAIDAGIPLSGIAPPIMSPQQVLSLQNLVQQNQAQKMEYAQTMETQRKAQQIQSIVNNPGSTDKNGIMTLDTINKITQADYQLGQKAAQNREMTLRQLSEQNSRQLADQNATEMLRERIEKRQKQIFDDAVSYVDQQTAGKDYPKEVKDRMFREAYAKFSQSVDGSGEHVLPDGVKDHANQRSLQMSYDEAKAHVTPPKDVQAQLNKDEKATIAAQQAEERAKMAAEKLQLEKDRFEFTKEKEKDKKEGQSGRSAVFTSRMVTSANEAIKDLENIVKLPMTVSRGWLGGRSQGPSLFEATKETFANKLSGEDVQLYNVMTAGIQRNLAAIEAVGLMPSGSLTHQMDSVVIKEGDTNLTKAAKLAQIRQILEGGLEPVLADPKVPDEIKSKVEQIIKSSQKAVPYTQQDVIKLMNNPDPNATLGSIVGKLGAPQTAGPQIPLTNAQGWKLHTDGKGRKAYVSPDGKSFEVATPPPVAKPKPDDVHKLSSDRADATKTVKGMSETVKDHKRKDAMDDEEDDDQDRPIPSKVVAMTPKTAPKKNPYKSKEEIRRAYKLGVINTTQMEDYYRQWYKNHPEDSGDIPSPVKK